MLVDPTTATERLSVLLVEDNPGDALLLTESLRDVTGPRFAIECVGTLADAVTSIDTPDVVLLDLGLPDSSGLDTLRALRSAGCRAPVVVVTGHDDDDTARQAVQAGAQDYVVKGSVAGPVLGRVVRHAIDRHRLQQVLSQQMRRRSSLSDLTRAALEGASVHDLMDEVSRILVTVLDVDAALVLEADGDRVVVRGNVGAAVAGTRGSCMDEGGGPLVQQVLTTGRPLVVEDLAGRPELARDWVARADVVAAVVVPVAAGPDAVAGAVLALSSTAATFDSADVAYLSDVAMALSQALGRASTEHERQERVKELTALFEAQRSMQGDAPLAAQLQEVGAHLVRGMQFPEDVSVTLAVDDLEVRTDGRAAVESIVEPIGRGPQPRGRIEVAHARPHGFLPEEHRLLAAIAEVIEVQVERRAATEAVRSSERWLRSLVTSLPGIVFTTDRDLRLVALEGGGLDVLGASREHVVGEDLATVLGDAPELPAVLAACGEALDGRTGQCEVQWASRTWQAVLEPTLDAEGDVAGVVGIALDITEAHAAEEALDESRRRLQGLFDNANDAIALMDDTGRYVDVNPATTLLVGRSREDLLDMRVGDLREGAEPLDEVAFWERLREHGSLQSEVAVRRPEPDGSLVILDYRAVADIVPGLHLVVARDVTERRAAEDALRRSEERFRALVQQATDAIMITDESLRLRYASPALSRILGHPVEELLGTSSFEHLHPDDAGLVDEALANVLGEGRPSESVRVRVRHRDGSWRLVDTVATDLREASAVRGIVVNVRDVTDQVRAVEALAESEARFRRIAENAHDVIFRVRLLPEPHLEYVSPAVAAVIGYEPHELFERPELVFGIAHPEDRSKLRMIDQDPTVLATPMVVRWLHRDGATVWVELRAAVVEEEDGLVVEGVARDVTEHKQAEATLVQALEQETRAADELRRIGQMKTRFLQAVSHEMRTPLTGIIGFTELLEARGEALPASARRELTERLGANALRLRELLGDLLDLNHLTSDTAALRRREVRLDRLLAAVADGVSLGGRRLTLDVPGIIADIDATRVERAVENLLDNAASHTPPDAQIWIVVERHRDGVVLRVEDSGDGVPEAEQQRVFEPFSQGDTPAARTGGAGIGLSIVAQTAELHGGRAWVEDRDGGGASFSILLPCSVSDPTATEGPAVAMPRRASPQ